MYTWKELADKFEDLQGPLQHSFISVQWGDAGTYLYLKGVHQNPIKNKFINLSGLAGEKLDSLPEDVKDSYPEVFQEHDFKDRWVKMIWKAGSGV